MEKSLGQKLFTLLLLTLLSFLPSFLRLGSMRAYSVSSFFSLVPKHGFDFASSPS